MTGSVVDRSALSLRRISSVDVRIGVLHTMKEIEVELPSDADPDEVKATIDQALADDDRVLWFTDRHGKQTGVPSERIAWIEIGSAESKSRIGFGAV
jgi:hypothetical protein